MRQRALLASVLSVLLAVAACGGDPPATPDSKPAPSGTPAAAEPEAFDPPSRFQAEGQTLARAPRPDGTLGVPQVAAVLVNRTGVYVDGTALAGVSLTTGEDEWVTGMPGVRETEDTSVTTPLLFEGRVYAAAAITVPGSTRVTGHRAISLAAVDPVTGGVVWTASIDAIPGDPVRDVRLVGVTADSIVVDTSTTTYVVDPTTRRTRWKVQFFEPTIVSGTVVAGQLGEDATQTKTRTVGFRLTDGVQLWASPTALQQGVSYPLSPGLMAVRGREFTSTDSYFDFLDAETGQSRFPGSTANLPAYDKCWFDARTLIVCAETTARNRVVGYQASDLREIWELPVGDRSAPRVTGVWHGAVYGVLAGKPATFDANTGAVRTASAGAAPEVINKYAGVTAESGSLTLFLAIG